MAGTPILHVEPPAPKPVFMREHGNVFARGKQKQTNDSLKMTYLAGEAARSQKAEHDAEDFRAQAESLLATPVNARTGMRSVRRANLRM